MMSEPEWGTEREFFARNLNCGDLPRSYDSSGKRGVMAYTPCGATNWRVIKPNFFAPWERALQCETCGLWTLVEIPAWKPGGALRPPKEKTP